MRRLLSVLIVATALIAAGSYVAWKMLLAPTADEPKTAQPPAADDQTVAISDQAQRTLGLISKPVSPTKYWKTMAVPGTVIDRPGVSDRGVSAPVAGVVTRARVTPGDVVRPGDALFDLRVTSELLLSAQARLFELAKELPLQEKAVKRLEASRGSVAESQIAEAKAQLSKLTTQISSSRQLLQSQGLTPAQIDDVELGKFLRQFTVFAPPADAPLVAVREPTSEGNNAIAYEVQDLKTQPGNQVAAGEVLAVLANHRLLFIEGRAFASEMPKVAEAAREGHPVEVEAPSGKGDGWETLGTDFRIRSLSAVVDQKSRTVGFYVPLVNEASEHVREGKTYLSWRFRPGQRVRLYVSVELMPEVIVLPREAVVREGAEAFVFRQNGDAFERTPVVVAYEDRRHVVLNKDSISPGRYVAMNNAAALNRALKSKADDGGGGHHHHH